MIAIIATLMIIALCGMVFVTGYYLGTGKIEITRTMNEEESKVYLNAQMKVLKEQEESHKQYQAMVKMYEQGGDF